MGPLLALCAVLAAGAVWVMPKPAPALARQAPVSAPEAARAPLDLAAVTARPLFDRTRKPLPQAAPAAAPAAPAPEVVTLSLQGVIGNATGGMTALLRLSNSDELFSLQVGDVMGNVTVQSIEARRVVMRDATGQTYPLELGTE